MNKYVWYEKLLRAFRFHLLIVIACVAWKGMESWILVILAHLKDRNWISNTAYYEPFWNIFFLVNFAKATVQNSFKEVSLNKFQWLESSKKMDVNKFHWMGYYFQNQIIITCKICFSILLGSVCSSLFVDHRVSCYYIPFNEKRR